MLKSFRCFWCCRRRFLSHNSNGICDTLFQQNESKRQLTWKFPRYSVRNFSTESHIREEKVYSPPLLPDENDVTYSTPQFNWEFLLNEDNFDDIAHNINIRKGVGNISDLVTFVHQYTEITGYTKEKVIESLNSANSHDEVKDIEAARLLHQKIIDCASGIPNHTNPLSPLGEEHESKLLELVGHKRDFDFKPKGVVQLGTDLHTLRTWFVGVGTGPRSYYFFGDFVKLQDALVNYTLDILSKEGFKVVYVPELIDPAIIEGCGFKTTGERHQVYHMWPPVENEALCLAGTGEMPLAGLLANRVFDGANLPDKYTAVSKCYRAEVAGREIEKGIYRVHQFTKVEMFGVADEESSDQLTEEFTNIQKKIFTPLGLHYRILNMASADLGAPAYCKHDMEAWMYEHGFWGEISSTSNCTDFQSRRLNIKYRDGSGNLKFAHTVNGTACAVPRLIMAIAEHYQTPEGNIAIPEVLQPYMGKSVIEKPQRFPRVSPHARLGKVKNI